MDCVFCQENSKEHRQLLHHKGRCLPDDSPVAVLQGQGVYILASRRAADADGHQLENAALSHILKIRVHLHPVDKDNGVKPVTKLIAVHLISVLSGRTPQSCLGAAEHRSARLLLRHSQGGQDLPLSPGRSISVGAHSSEDKGLPSHSLHCLHSHADDLLYPVNAPAPHGNAHFLSSDLFRRKPKAFKTFFKFFLHIFKSLAVVLLIVDEHHMREHTDTS